MRNVANYALHLLEQLCNQEVPFALKEAGMWD